MTSVPKNKQGKDSNRNLYESNNGSVGDKNSEAKDDDKKEKYLIHLKNLKVLPMNTKKPNIINFQIIKQNDQKEMS